MLKTYDDWKSGLTEYLEVGDEVDQKMVDYFINVLPPACMNGKCVQMGEPYTHGEDKAGKWRPKYLTLRGDGGKWYYAGICFRGETEE